ncbi:DUF126 domain-containing protein [Pararhodobacter sp. SW119]|uniref:aconitase X swivel domain-containing protein n=1 Tax=Pararhodobacter sp. SW119 TaxID=2780075 RepID=UPI001ADF9531|nr:DUF126 domain-containing protein [Pararhodobacter sp. SW119]
MTETGWKARGVVKGMAEGPALISQTALSFLGDLDIRSGRVVGRSSDLCGEVVTGRVLVLPETRGSAGAWRFLYQLKVHETHPAALVLRELPDPSVTQGAFLAEVPIVVVADTGFWQAVTPGDRLRVDAVAGRVTRV